MLPFYPKPPVWKRRKSLGIAYNHPLRLNQKYGSTAEIIINAIAKG
jgi:hypothetical protein